MRRLTIALPVGVALVCGAIAVASLGRAEPTERVLATYSTTLEGRLRSQRHNAELCLDRLNGVELGPHEVFSFNRSVGTWSRDRGYRKAPVSYNGQLINSWGGGVCQTSTTLYNAALLAGLPIVERHRHRFAPGYVPPGRDAAVAFDRIDLRFVNPYPFPIRLKGTVENGRLVVRILGEGPGKSATVTTEVRQRRTPLTVTISGGTSGRVRNSGKDGFEVLVWRALDGRRELVSVDDYPAMNRIVEYRR
ncbi:MAG TPA: VanW family protein [Fimbriimonadaceae bacterium]|nr:VanW family protein [Fimbriimonadaceae bacterium]HRJ97256.1 VanW family protein [Fimbriimonadaceae bacterium]